MSDLTDAFAVHRRAAPAVTCAVAGQEVVMFLRHRDVKALARDWERCSSDAPFRVPIPSEEGVRSVRQLPIETDPPDHREYRLVVRKIFGRQRTAAIAPDLRRCIGELLEAALDTGELEAVRQLALPLQSRALALLLGRPPEEAEEWIGWGVHVFHDVSSGSSHSADLQRYLDRVLDEAIAAPGDDFFGVLARGTFRGRPLAREEMLGFANLAFAGGRDTVINLITSSLAHLARNPPALDAMRADPALVETATEEFLRYHSPLTHIGRVVRHDTEQAGRPLREGQTVSLCWASANRDPEVFDRAEEVVLDRSPNRHMAFGHGTHVCLGAPLTRAIMHTLLRELAARVTALEVIQEEPAHLDAGVAAPQIGYERLMLRFVPGPEAPPPAETSSKTRRARSGGASRAGDADSPR